MDPSTPSSNGHTEALRKRPSIVLVGFRHAGYLYLEAQEPMANKHACCEILLAHTLDISVNP